MARLGPDAPHPDPSSASAVRLAALMNERNVSVRTLAKAVARGQRKTIQRWLAGKPISRPHRERLAAYFEVDPEEFKPPDVLADLRPLLEQVEQLRRDRQLKVNTVVGELRRLAEANPTHPG